MDAEITRILHVDRHPVARAGLAALVAGEPDLILIGEGTDISLAPRLVDALKPDLVVTAIDVPDLNCFTVLDSLRRRTPRPRTLIFSEFQHDGYIARALDAGVDGYVTKDAPVSTVRTAIRRIAHGERFFSENIQSRIVPGRGAASADQTRTSRTATLTAREMDILRCLSLGMSVKQVADTLCISAKTVDNHKTKLMFKLGIHDRVELSRMAIREGIVTA